MSDPATMYVDPPITTQADLNLAIARVNAEGYVSMTPNRNRVMLDGNFTVEELRAFIAIRERANLSAT